MSNSSTPGLRTQRFATATLALLMLLGVAPQAAPTADLQEILIGMLDQRTAGVTDSWSFDVEIIGTDITTITLQTPPSTQFPGGETLDQTDFEQDGDDWCLEVDFPEPGGLAALQNRFVPGNYTFTINGVPIVLNYNPLLPDGLITVSFPANFATMPNGQPTFTSTSTCSNCNIVEAIVENNLGTIEIETPLAISPAPLPSSFQFSDFGPNFAGPPITSLPLGAYGLCVLSSAVTISVENLGGGDPFQYIQERGNDDLVNFTVTSPTLASNVDEMEIFYAEFDDEWFFGTFVDGAGITSGMVVPPNSAPIMLLGEGFDEFEFEDGPFIDEAAVRLAHPPTAGVDKYVVVIDGGERFFSADFAPGSPNGGIDLLSPANGATTSSTPSFSIANACTNCTGQFIELESLADEGVDMQVFSPSLPYPTTVDFGDFDPNQGTLGPISELPQGDYDAELDTAVELVQFPSFVPMDDFTYYSATFRVDAITFTVPEPAAWMAQLFAGVTLAGLRRARRRR